VRHPRSLCAQLTLLDEVSARFDVTDEMTRRIAVVGALFGESQEGAQGVFSLFSGGVEAATWDAAEHDHQCVVAIPLPCCAIMGWRFLMTHRPTGRAHRKPGGGSRPAQRSFLGHF
jgi:hypothetical protein